MVDTMSGPLYIYCITHLLPNLHFFYTMISLSEEIPGNRVVFTHPTCTRSVFERVTITP